MDALSGQSVKLKGRQFQRFTMNVDIDIHDHDGRLVRREHLCISTKGFVLWLANQITGECAGRRTGYRVIK